MVSLPISAETRYDVEAYVQIQGGIINEETFVANINTYSHILIF
mgnify:CR=1 FL=1